MPDLQEAPDFLQSDQWQNRL